MFERGQIQISFGIIFSLIVIVAIISVSAYFIVSFLKTKECIEIANFKKNLQEEVNRAYSSEGQSKTFSQNIPSKVKWVCFGSIDKPLNSQADKVRYDYFRSKSFATQNIFFYPIVESCKKDYSAGKLEKVQELGFFCVQSKSGKIELIVSKEVSENYVKLSKK